MDLILATADGREIGFIPYDADIDCGGDDSTFEIGIPRAAWDDTYEAGMLVYVPGTEYGGIIGEMESETNPAYVYVRGMTWRGLLEHKIISPKSGEDYYTISGEANACIAELLSAFYGDSLVQASSDSSDVTISNYSFERYTNLLDGMNAMLSPHNQKILLRYVQTETGGYLEVSTDSIVNYAAQIEFSEDDNVVINSDQKLNGVNHLICLGQGELSARTVVHIYTDAEGNISTAQVLFGRDEIVAVYDNNGAENAEELRKGGLEYLEDIKSRITLDVQVINLDEELQIGDIVSGRDFTTGLYAERHIAEKILTIIGEIPDVQYILGD